MFRMLDFAQIERSNGNHIGTHLDRNVNYTLGFVLYSQAELTQFCFQICTLASAIHLNVEEW